MDRDELYEMLSGSALMGGAKKKKLSKWNLYVRKHADSGKSMKQLSREYKKRGGAFDDAIIDDEDEELLIGSGRRRKKKTKKRGGVVQVPADISEKWKL